MTEQQLQAERMKAKRGLNRVIAVGSAKRIFRKYFFIYSVIILLIVSFLCGLLVENKRKIIKSDNLFGNLNELNSGSGDSIEKFFSNKDIEKKDLPQNIDFDLFWDVWRVVKENYVDQPVDEEKLFKGALAGIVASLGDRYSVYLEKETTKQFTDDLSGSFEGIGAEIGIKDERLTIIAPLSGSPAEEAGLMAGDKILKVDGRDTVRISIDEAVTIIRGEKGTPVTLNIYREGEEDPMDIVVIRGTIKIESIKWKMLNFDGKEDDSGRLAYLEISHFNGDTIDMLNKNMRHILAKNPHGLIIDVRSNPGGFLETAIVIASKWVEDGVIVSEKLSDGSKIEHFAKGKAMLKDFKTVVLVNQGSASASEIVAGALQDYSKATIIGKKTFGKGSVQDLKKLKDGSSIKITIAKWLTPSGRSISEEGISPDIEIDLNKEDFDNDRDPQLDEAVKFLAGQK